LALSGSPLWLPAAEVFHGHEAERPKITAMVRTIADTGRLVAWLEAK